MSLLGSSDFALTSYNPNVPFGVPMESIPLISSTVYGVQWMAMRSNYWKYWEWFDGRALDTTDPTVKTGDPSLYPLKINPVEMVCTKHAGALFGEVPDDSDSMVQFYYKNEKNVTDEVCESLADTLQNIWSENNGRALQQQNAIVSQFLGGSVFKVSYDRDNPDIRPSKIRIEAILPDFFLPVYDMTDPFNLIECYVMYYISAQEAKSRYNVVIDNPNTTRILYSEHWTKDSYEIQVGGQTPVFQVGMVDYVTKGKHGFGCVPFVYIPHLRRVGGFYGWSHVPSLIGISKELNSRLTDIGDNVRDNAQSLYWVRNVAYALKVRRIEDQITVLDLGGSGPSGREPELNRLDVPASNTMASDYVKELWEYVEKAGAVPGVAWGNDEGSQRSALTLSVRMWPLLSHIRDERSQWTMGFKYINRIILKILASKGSDLISDGMEKLSCRVKWYNVMPRERLEQVEEMVARKGVNLVSKKQALITMSNSEDITAELSEIEADMEFEAKMQQIAKPPTQKAVSSGPL